jgi:hypothetical protein
MSTANQRADAPKDTNMTKKNAARTTRRERRNAKRAIAVQVTNHLIAPSLKPAELKILLAKFAKLTGGAK